MVEGIVFTGRVIIVLAVLGILVFSYRMYRRQQRKNKEQQDIRLEYRQLEELEHPAEVGQVQVERKSIKQSQAPKADYSVLSRIKLEEYWQRRGETTWTPKINHRIAEGYLVSGPDGEEWIFNIGTSDEGPLIVAKGRLLGTHEELQFQYKGTESDPGWAKEFKQSDQLEPVIYELEDITPGIKWSLVDIGSYKIHVLQGDTDAFVDGDRLYFVTSRSSNDQWLLFIDARVPEANGPCGLFLLTKVNQSILQDLS